MKFRLICDSSTGNCELIDSNGSPMQVANSFLNFLHIRGLSSHTIRSYGYDLLAASIWLSNTKKNFKQITTTDLLEFISLQKESSLSPKTINRRLTTIGSFYRFSFGHDIPSAEHTLSTNPHYRNSGKEQHLGLHNRKKKSSQKLKVKEAKRLIEPLQPNEIKVFLRSITRYRDLAIVYLMLFCGLRSSEVRALQWKDINTFEMKIKVRGKGNKERIVPFPEKTKDILGKYKQIEYPKSNSSELVFVVLQGVNRGKGMAASGLRSLFRYKRKISGIAKANPHRFRHTCGADLAKQKMDVFHIQKILGHEHFSTSLQYINLSLEDLSEEFHLAIKNIQKRYASNNSI